MPEIALAVVDPEAPADGCAPFACGLSTGIGAALYTAEVRAGLDGRRVRLRPRRPRRGDRRAPRRRRADRRVRPRRRSASPQARHHGATDTRVAGDDTVDWIRSETGGFGADYTFEATGNVAVMRQAVEAAREAWGLATMCGVAGQGRAARGAAASADHRPPRHRQLVRRREGPDAGARCSSTAGSPARSTSTR